MSNASKRCLTLSQNQEKTPFSFFRSRIKISFSNTRLNDIVDKLRLYNEDLRVLSRQISELTETMLKKTHHPHSIVSELRLTREASSTLHKLLSTNWPCSNQITHKANLALNIGQAQDCRTASRFKFGLSLCCHSNNEPSHQDVTWIQIESTPKAKKETAIPTEIPSHSGPTAAGEATNSSTAQSRQLNNPKQSSFKSSASKAKGIASPKQLPCDVTSLTKTLTEMGITGRSVRFAEKDLASNATKLLPKPPEAIIDPPNIYTVSNAPFSGANLCEHFRTHLPQSDAQISPAIYNEAMNSFEHFIYICKCPQGFENRTQSLNNYLEQLAISRRREAWQAKFRLAQLLTLSVLRFHATPWLPNGLRSSDIYFLEKTSMDPQTGDSALSSQSPSLQALLPGQHIPETAPQVNQQRLALYRNEALFKLGVMLLEIGYDAPITYLRQPEDNIQGLAPGLDIFTDFFTAKRLGLSALTQLDSRYGKLVKRCLDCDFGVGNDDLDSVDLQTAIVVSIVNELDNCIAGDEQVNVRLAGR